VLESAHCWVSYGPGSMGTSGPQSVTTLLQAWSDGDESALNKLTPLVYAELRRIAHHYMAGEASGHSLQTTALIHETYLRLIDHQKASWQDRAHFFSMCAHLMRSILTDFARSRLAQKRGGNAPHLSLDEAPEISAEPRADLVALDEALKRLAAFDARKSQLVELRYFGGLTEDEAAEVLGISARTVRRDWKMAKVWLLRELSDGSQHES
jgi:RNA polymerase sigma factor (TIGR02999 family)